MDKEIWKPVVGFEGFYEISNTGKVKSLNRQIVRSNGRKQTFKERILKSTRDGYGYEMVRLQKLGFSKNKKIHGMIAEAFMGHVPCGHALVVDHIDNDNTNNHISNLQIITNRENCSKDQSGGTSKYIGVSLVKGTCKWQSLIVINKKIERLGFFDNEKDASNAYQKRLKEHLNGSK